MAFIRHIFLLSCYLALALGIGFYGPVAVPGLGETQAAMLGAFLFFAAAILHEVYARLGRDSYLGEQVLTLRQDLRDLSEEVGWSQRQVKGLREALEDAADVQEGSRSGKSVDEIIAEVKVLQSLVMRLSETRKEESKLPDARDQMRSLADAVQARPEVRQPRVDAPQPPEDPDPDTVRDWIAPAILEGLSERQVIDVARKALRDDRVDVFLQPIVSLPQRRRRFYECLSRLRTADGRMIVPEQYISLAEREGLVAAIDNMLLFRCIQLIRKIQRRKERLDFFCNLSTLTLEDGDFLEDLSGFLKANGDLASHLVFEFSQSDYENWESGIAQRLQHLVKLGCRLSLDRAEDLNIDPQALAARGIAYLKVDAVALLGKLSLEPALAKTFRKQGVTLIACKVENEEILVELLDHGIHYAQGYLVGEPRLARIAA